MNHCPRIRVARLTALTACLALAGAPLDAAAQLRLPALPSLPTLPAPSVTAPRFVARDAASTVDLARRRLQRIARLLREQGAVLEADPAGEPVVRGELVWADPSDALLAAARADGFGVLRERTLDGLDMRWVTLGIPAGWDTARALRRLRELDPEAHIDFNHVYLDSGQIGAVKAIGPATSIGPAPAAAMASSADGSPATAPAMATAVSATPSALGPPKVGLIDGGIDVAHPALRSAHMQPWGCGGRTLASAHGTAVASLLVGRAGAFHGAAPDATLYAADVYCQAPAGGAVEAVALALSWLASERVPVVNISLVGPPNRLLELLVRRAGEKGMLLVAAVGNDGPAAAPLYPAGYPGVVAVTAVDTQSKVLPEACRGPHVAFAAPGADLAVAAANERTFTSARGTSFAAPLVAGLLAASLRTADPASAALAVAALAHRAVDLGASGRDPVYGHGLVAQSLRFDPTALNVPGH